MNAVGLVLAAILAAYGNAPTTHGAERAFVVCSESSGQRCRGYIIDDGDIATALVAGRNDGLKGTLYARIAK